MAADLEALLDALELERAAVAGWSMAHGSDDVVIPAANADLLATRWRAARVERFNDGGHAFIAQEPVRLARLIADFAGD